MENKTERVKFSSRPQQVITKGGSLYIEHKCAPWKQATGTPVYISKRAYPEIKSISAKNTQSPSMPMPKPSTPEAIDTLGTFHQKTQSV